MKIEMNKIVTTFEIPNYTVIKSLGIVKGISVRSTRGMRAGFQTLVAVTLVSM
jgi:uncharacterized protein YbjQ (UPF0145 family)